MYPNVAKVHIVRRVNANLENVKDRLSHFPIVLEYQNEIEYLNGIKWNTTKTNNNRCL